MTREWQSDDEVALTADIIDLARQYDATDIVEYLAQIQEKQFSAMLSCDVAHWHIASFRRDAEFGRYLGIADMTGLLAARPRRE